MTSDQIDNYLSSVNRQFSYYKSLGDKAIAQLSEEEIYRRTDGNSNSVAVLMKHLAGNMLSRWTDFLTTDGEKDWRKRDQEFEIEVVDLPGLMVYWEKGWACLFNALAQINAENIDQTVYIRNMGHTIIDAVNRQLCHYAYHIGQLVFLAKMYKADNWVSLSIPVGKSNEYNADKFGKDKRMEHFTDDL